MSHVEVRVDCPLYDSFRVQQVAGLFDVPLPSRLCEVFKVEIPSADEPWRIGVIAGPSGSGKTSVARAAFGDALWQETDWPADRAVIDCFGELPIKQLTALLTSVGFGSPPAWIKPYGVLSGGEQFRCQLARALAQPRPLVAFDEFTSVVDRTVARIGSAAVARAIRAGPAQRRFVAVTCHYDVIEWLEPDWVVDLATARLERRRLRRPQIELELYRGSHREWQRFARHHYLSGSLSPYAECFVARWERQPVGFVAVLNAIGRRGIKRISRIVVLPDYQGIGIGSRLLDCVAQRYHQRSYRVTITTSHPAMIAHLRRAANWRIYDVKRGGHARSAGSKEGSSTSRGRAVIGARYYPAPPPARSLS